MNSRKIAELYGLNKNEFEDYLRKSNIFHTESFNDNDIKRCVEKFEQYRVDLAAEEERKATEKVRQAAEQAGQATELSKKNAELAKMLITSGFSFDGYTIKKYSGYISGDDAVQVERGYGGIFGKATNVGDALMASLVKIRRNALAELKEAAYALGCNAVIGVDFDYITLEPEASQLFGDGKTLLPYVFGVTANGNAVVIEKNKTADED